MATTKPPRTKRNAPGAPTDEADAALVSTLELAPGWDPERQTLTHDDPGKRALALVNAAAKKKRPS